MKKLILTLFLIVPFVVSSQCLRNSFLNILDEYIKKETQQKSVDKDSIVISAYFDKIDDGYAINLSMYELKYFPNTDSLKMYNNVRMIVRYPNKFKKKLSKYFKPIKERREFKEVKINTIYEPISNFLFQLKGNGRFYIISTSDDDYYYEKFKDKKMKFSKDLKFSKDISN